jgi:hypothetical protein
MNPLLVSLAAEAAVHLEVMSTPTRRVPQRGRHGLCCFGGNFPAYETGIVRMTRHVDPKCLFEASERPDPGQNGNSPLSAGEWPLTCADGSLIINADGSVSRATPEQQRIALIARAARAAMGGSDD